MTKHANRYLLKLSGEVLKGDQPQGISPEVCQKLSVSIKSLVDEGYHLGLVIGGGNFFRGGEQTGMDRSPADQIGMLATIMNGIALKHYFEAAGCPTRVLSGLDCPKAVDSFTWRKAMGHLDEGRVVIFVGGTGNPYFTTDTAAALRACEIGATKLLKATKVDGVYSKDPVKYPDAVRYDKITYDQVLEEDLQVMDGSAFALCRSNQVPILVFHMDLLLAGIPVQMKKLEEQGSLVE